MLSPNASIVPTPPPPRASASTSGALAGRYPGYISVSGSAVGALDFVGLEVSVSGGAGVVVADTGPLLSLSSSVSMSLAALSSNLVAITLPKLVNGAVSATLDSSGNFTVPGVGYFGTQNASLGNGVLKANAFYGNTVYSAGNNAIVIQSQVSDGATAVLFQVDSYNPLNTSGAKIASFKQGGVEKFSIDKDGSPKFTTWTPVGIPVIATSEVRIGAGGDQTIRCGSIVNIGASPVSLRGNAADGATAYGVRFGCSQVLATTGARIAGFFSDTFTTERFAVGAQGELVMKSGSGGALADGTLWFDGGDLQLRASGTTYTLTKS